MKIPFILKKRRFVRVRGMQFQSLLKKLSQLEELVEGSAKELWKELKEDILALEQGYFALEEYNRSLSLKMAERTQELQELLEKLKKEQVYQVAYNELVTVLNSSVELESLLQNALLGILKFSQSQAGILYLFDKGKEVLCAQKWVGVHPEHREFALGEGLPGKAAEQREFLILEKIPEESHFFLKGGIFEGPPQAIGYFPFIYQEELLGVFELATFEGYSEEMQRHMKSALVQVAIAVHNRILYKQSQEMAQKFKAMSEKLAEKNKALEIQKRMLAEQKRELDFKNRELLAASQQKSNFLTTMSHELRTPLNSIIGYTDLVLKKGKDSLGEHRKKLEKVLQNAYHLLSLINNILDLSKIEAGKMELFVEEFSIESVVQSCLSTVQGLIEGKPVELEVKIAKDLPRLRTDQGKLKQVLINLLGNAAKFTERGKISLEVSLCPERPSWVQIAVSDTGPGIPKEKLPHIFDSFTQVDNSPTRRHGGTGLGLAIVKKMTQLMNGEVSVESQEGVGTTFVLKLPIDVYSHIISGEEEVDLSEELEKGEKVGEVEREAVEKALEESLDVKRETVGDSPGMFSSSGEEERKKQKESGEALEQGSKTAKKQILLIDDEEVVRDVFENLLEGTEYELLWTSKGKEGLELAKSKRPRLIVLDIILKDMSGWKVLRELKGSPETASIPVVVSSNVDNPLLVESAGADAFLPKPVNKEEFFKILKRWELPVGYVLFLSRKDSPCWQEACRRGQIPFVLAENLEQAIGYCQDRMPRSLVADLTQDASAITNIVERLLLHFALLDFPIYVLYPKGAGEPSLEIADRVFFVSSSQLDLSELYRELGGESTLDRKPRILVVEDVPDNLEFVKDILCDEYEVICAMDGKEGVEKALKEKPDLILMDLLLPQMDGLEATRAIHKNPETAHIPIIALTAHAMVGDREKALKSGCVDYLTKPIVGDVLKKRVKEVLRRYAKR